jgi:hypothetical protein
MNKDKNRQGQQDTSRHGQKSQQSGSRQGRQGRSADSEEEAAVIEYILVNYDVTPDEAAEVIEICGITDRGKIDDYMEEKGTPRMNKSGDSGKRQSGS